MNRRTFLLRAAGCRRDGSASCGYALAGRGSFLPAYIQTIGIPQFVNNTPYYEVEQVFTERVRTEFINRGKYKVLPEATGVDALLNGEIMSITHRAGQLPRPAAGQPLHHPGHREDRVPRPEDEQGASGTTRSGSSAKSTKPRRPLTRSTPTRSSARTSTRSSASARVREVGRQRDPRSVLTSGWPQLRPDAVRQQIASASTVDPVYLIVGDDDHEKSALALAFGEMVEEDLRAFNVERLYATDGR